MKLLIIGDPHAKKGDLEDCGELAGLVRRTAKATKPDWIVWLGDQHHHHSIIHVEVMQFWLEFLGCLKGDGFKQIMVVGNHDLADNGDSFAHALIPYKNLVEVVEVSRVIDGVMYMPYFANPQAFVDMANGGDIWDPELPKSNVLICHQLFDGSKYDNGFYAKDGIDANLIPQGQVVSGHVHAPQMCGKVWYPGSPRWQTLSDANVDRAIWLVEIENGKIVNKTPYSTNGVCRQIRHLVETPGSPVDEKLFQNAKVHLDLQGPSDWIVQRKKELSGKGLQIRTFPTDQKMVRVKESDGIGKAFAKYVDAYQPKFGTSKVTLREMLKDRLDAVPA